ncbi:MAG TPA: hypothetical protein VFU41_05385 [Gemmatimonadales bacterium]|nr:hypothetical protein [Gemmatimonadales bacterium]
MSETSVVLLAIIIAALTVTVSVALSLARVAPPAAAREHPAVLPASVLCPTTGDVALVEIGFDWATGELAVASCERFRTGAFECDRECFPTQVLTPSVAVAGSLA